MSNYWKIPGIPHKGWELIDVIDLADNIGFLEELDLETCMMCGNENIRYIHVVTHDEVEEEFRVGCVCAEKMTGDYVNPKRLENNLRNKSGRRKSWANLNWKWSKKGNLYLKKDNHILTIFKDKRSGKFKCMIDDEFGTVYYSTIREAKAALFNKAEERKEKGTW